MWKDIHVNNIKWELKEEMKKIDVENWKLTEEENLKNFARKKKRENSEREMKQNFPFPISQICEPNTEEYMYTLSLIQQDYSGCALK